MKYNKVNILWSGITGRTGKLAMEKSKNNDFATIVAGISRTNQNFYNYNELENIEEKYDVIVDFSHTDSFDKVLELALKKRKPLIIGTSNLSENQINKIQQASKIIPIFKGRNFIFNVKNFMDDVIDYAKTMDSDIKLIETHYKTKKIPSQTALELKERVKNEAGKDLIIESKLEYDSLINDYKVDNLHLHIEGFEQLAEDILKIASLMNNDLEPELYNLNKLLNYKKVIPRPPVGTAKYITGEDTSYIDSDEEYLNKLK